MLSEEPTQQQIPQLSQAKHSYFPIMMKVAAVLVALASIAYFVPREQAVYYEKGDLWFDANGAFEARTLIRKDSTVFTRDGIAKITMDNVVCLLQIRHGKCL